MYIITYVTHSERYLPILKESYPDIVILGHGEKWNGFEDKVLATLEFCKQHPHDIICFIDGFDSVVLSTKEEILQKYESMQTPLVMSHASIKKSIIQKYVQDKLFGKCKNERLNSGMFIGTSESILSFWKDFQGGDDQTYATQKCKNFNMKIDVNHDIFYNYSSNDDIVVKNDRLYVNNVATCIISCPGNSNINPYLKQLGYSPPEIHYNFDYRIKTYMKLFLPEIIVFFFIGLCLCICSFPFSLAVSFLLFTTLMEYELHIKHYPISFFYKILCLQLDMIHVILCMLVIYLLFNLECNIKKLFILNLLYLFIVLCFFHFKRCLLSIFQNKFMQKNVSWTGPADRVAYFFQPDKQYINEEKGNMIKWMESNKITVSLVFLLNLYCFTKL